MTVLLRAHALVATAVLLLVATGAAADGPTPSFPGAEGFGATTPGGRGGPVIAVTSLADSGPGTLRWALEEVDGPRIVVFSVEGEIALASQIRAQGRLTLLGHVAPGAGVTVSGASLRIAGDDVIVRGMRIRPGDGPGQDKSVRDALTIGARDGRRVRRIVVDRNSFAWSTDEVVNIWDGAGDVTISNNIIAEALRDAGHPQGPHSMGMLVGDRAENVTIVGNFFANSEFRNPTIAKATNIEVVNNYVYNYGQHALSFTMREGLFTRAHVLGNHFERGPSSGRQKAVRILGAEDGGAFWLVDNLSHDRPRSSLPERAVAGGVLNPTLQDGPLFAPSGVTAIPARDVKARVLAEAGARRPHLDAVDARIVADALTGTGRLVDSPRDRGPLPPDPAVGLGFPPAGGSTFSLDAPDLHLPEPGSPYTAIELYAHALATGG